jgi:hypothetical protein
MSISSHAPLPEAEFDQTALPGENFGRELAAVLAGHGSLDAFDDGGDGASIILELLGTSLSGREVSVLAKRVILELEARS